MKDTTTPQLHNADTSALASGASAVTPNAGGPDLGSGAPGDESLAAAIDASPTGHVRTQPWNENLYAVDDGNSATVGGLASPSAGV